MTTILLIIHLLIALALVGVILLQRSEGGALGIGGGGVGGLMTGRSSANLLTRATAILAAGFITTSLLLAIVATHQSAPRSILDQPAAPAAEPAAPDRAAGARRAVSCITGRDASGRSIAGIVPTRVFPDSAWPMTRFVFVTGGVVSSLGKDWRRRPSAPCSRRAAIRSGCASSIPISTSTRGP